ncbi:hypothetical protein AAF712_012454 [Marasmius tenuissimus]|uniref:Uncharacterized protein n=1 Tax=Marasmius tenuissimus TaxID=585030 RepID=A0ABR2ZHH7_9AGAR
MTEEAIKSRRAVLRDPGTKDTNFVEKPTMWEAYIGYRENTTMMKNETEPASPDDQERQGVDAKSRLQSAAWQNIMPLSLQLVQTSCAVSASSVPNGTSLTRMPGSRPASILEPLRPVIGGLL